ncbi:N-acetyltransferase [Hoeflea sp. AS60]|uniref:GNAT family N-acetyltransferase n=1 Tax=Hoeflea sp. AS60 TaxID=3135780 RepID=UPI00317A505C
MISNETCFVIDNEAEFDVPAREALLDRAMGVDRRRKSSEKLRRGRLPSPGLAFVARNGAAQVIGSVRLWDAAAGDKALLLLGPLAVNATAEGRGIGSALMQHAIAQAKDSGHGAIILVGDAPYYERFGFSAEKTCGLMMPGPVERHRLLGLELVENHLEDASGLLVASGRQAMKGGLLRAARRMAQVA